MTSPSKSGSPSDSVTVATGGRCSLSHRCVRCRRPMLYRGVVEGERWTPVAMFCGNVGCTFWLSETSIPVRAALSLVGSPEHE